MEGACGEADYLIGGGPFLGLSLGIGLPYDVYAELFPPGEPDQNAREAAYNFAKANGCTIENELDAKIVFFIKPKKRA